jgi:uncharacterized protein
VRFRLTPQDTAFFDLLSQAATTVVEGAELLDQLLAAPASERPAIAEKLKDAEHRCDGVVHDTLRRLNSTFVTPFDREDIYNLISALDDCLDELEEAGTLVVLYRMGEVPEGVRRQSRILLQQARCTAAGMPRLRTLEDLASYWVEINRLENEADGVYHTLIADLFAAAPDPLELIKVKDVAAALESAADAFEQVAHHVESIAVKES